MEVLDRLSARFPLCVETIRARPLDHSQVLEIKRRAHIVIDECVTGSYHRNSLEGLAAGCVVVNALGSRPDIMATFRLCAGSEAYNPFTYADLERLERVLCSLIERGTEELVADGARNRQWMEQHWDFGRQWERFWMPEVVKSLERVGRRLAA
jgi:hypothetical protein